MLNRIFSTYLLIQTSQKTHILLYTKFADIVRFLKVDFEHLKPVIDALPGVETVHGGESPVSGGLAEDDPPDPAVEESHGAHVAGLLVQVHLTARAQVSRAWTSTSHPTCTRHSNRRRMPTWTEAPCVCRLYEGASSLQGGDSVNEDHGRVVERVGQVGLCPRHHQPRTVQDQAAPPLLTLGHGGQHLLTVQAGPVQNTLQVFVRMEICWPEI